MRALLLPALVFGGLTTAASAQPAGPAPSELAPLADNRLGQVWGGQSTSSLPPMVSQNTSFQFSALLLPNAPVQLQQQPESGSAGAAGADGSAGIAGADGSAGAAGASGSAGADANVTEPASQSGTGTGPTPITETSFTATFHLNDLLQGQYSERTVVLNPGAPL